MKDQDYILVVGLNRSGTKWLSNMLSNHRQIFAVTAEQHFGIVESNIFNDISRVLPSLQREDDYTAFVCMWAESDFVKTTGVSRDEMLNWQPRPSTPYDAYTRLMDETTRRQSKSVWLQKCSPIQAFQSQGKLKPAAKVVVIRRPFDRVLESSIALHKQSGANTSFLRNVVVAGIQNRMIDHFWTDKKCLGIQFDDLKSNTESTLKRVCEYLELPFDADLTKTKFQQNTSFRNRERRPLTLTQKMICRLVQFNLKCLPVSWVAKIWERSRSRRPFSIVAGTYRHFGVEKKCGTLATEHDK